MAEIEIQRRLTKRHLGIGNLCLEIELNTLGRLDLEYQTVGRATDFRVFLAAIAEHPMGRRTELDYDLGRSARHRLAAAEIERHALPSPVVDPQPDGGEGSRCAIGRDTRFVTVCSVLRAERRGLDRLGGHRVDRAEDLDLLVTNRFGLDSTWGLHRDKSQKLEQVILEHIAQHA